MFTFSTPDLPRGSVSEGGGFMEFFILCHVGCNGGHIRTIEKSIKVSVYKSIKKWEAGTLITSDYITATSQHVPSDQK